MNVNEEKTDQIKKATFNPETTCLENNKVYTGNNNNNNNNLYISSYIYLYIFIYLYISSLSVGKCFNNSITINEKSSIFLHWPKMVK